MANLERGWGASWKQGAWGPEGLGVGVEGTAPGHSPEGRALEEAGRWSKVVPARRQVVRGIPPAPRAAEAPHSLASVLGPPELVPFVLGMLLLQGPDPGDDLLQRLVGLLGVVDDECGVLLLLWPVIHGSASAGLCSAREG